MDDDEARETIAEWRDLARRIDDAGTTAAFELCADSFEEYLNDE